MDYSHKSGIFPSTWKHAYVTLIHKNEHRIEVTYYRSIFILSIMCYNSNFIQNSFDKEKVAPRLASGEPVIPNSSRKKNGRT